MTGTLIWSPIVCRPTTYHFTDFRLCTGLTKRYPKLPVVQLSSGYLRRARARGRMMLRL